MMSSAIENIAETTIYEMCLHVLLHKFHISDHKLITSHIWAPQQESKCGSRSVSLQTGHFMDNGGSSTNKLLS